MSRPGREYTGAGGAAGMAKRRIAFSMGSGGHGVGLGGQEESLAMVCVLTRIRWSLGMTAQPDTFLHWEEQLQGVLEQARPAASTSWHGHFQNASNFSLKCPFN